MKLFMKKVMKGAMKISICNRFLGFAAVAALSLMTAGAANAAPPRHPAATLAQPQQTAAADSDHTLAAMQDELDRARTRLELTIPGTNQPARPYYVQYRVLDLDVRTIVAEFGALVSSTRGRNRIMSVDVRVGDDNLDSSNFITDEGFTGFLGSTGTIGIDRDYDSLRQDLWLATDQAFKAAVENFSKKQAFMSRLAKAPSIPDFSPADPTVSGLERAQLGAGGQNGIRGLAPVSAVVQLARDLSPDLHHELSAQQRRHQDSRESQPCGHRSQPRNRIG
jgi:hypothetical protein